MRESHVIHLKIPKELKQWLQEYAEQQSLDMTTIIRILLERERVRESKQGATNGYHTILSA